MSRPRVLTAEWVLPASAPPIRSGAVLVDAQGRIAAVGPAEAIDAPADVERRDFGRAALIPGLVNVHAHPELAMFRGALEDLPFRDWILRLVGAKRTVLSHEDHEVAARWTAIEAIRAGITTVAATEASGAAAAALGEAGLRGIVYVEAFGPDPRSVDASLNALERLVDRVGSQAGELVGIGVSPHAPYTVSDALYTATARFADRKGLPIAVHIAESDAERALVVAGAGAFAPGLATRGISTDARARSPIALLESTGILERAPLLVHCVDVDDPDIELIARRGASVAHCPTANARLGHGIAPIVEMRRAGIGVGLGTDSVGSNNRLDLLEEARTASLLQRARLRSADDLPPDELLRLATIEGARAIGLADEIGSLEPGKSADITVVSFEGAHVRPVNDPGAALFHAARGSDVVATIVGGRLLFEHGAVTTMDEAAIADDMERIALRLRESV